MKGKFLKGVLIGGAVGAAIASKWDVLAGKCAMLEEIKEKVMDDMHVRTSHKAHGMRPRTRLMARRHRVKNCT